MFTINLHFARFSTKVRARVYLLVVKCSLFMASLSRPRKSDATVTMKSSILRTPDAQLIMITDNTVTLQVVL